MSFDFVPGDRVLFYDDYTGDNVGDFPRRLEFAEGNAEVAEWEGGKWLRVSKSAKFAIVMPEPLPERFTVEFDYVTNHTREQRLADHAEHERRRRPTGRARARRTPPSASPTTRVAYTPGRSESEARRGDLQNKVTRARIMADGKYTKVYMNGVRVANAPNADLGRSNKIQFWVPGYDPEGVQATLIGPIRIAAGGKKLYDALAEKGRVATQGIYFDTGSDGIRAESAPTLKEIGTMLKDHRRAQAHDRGPHRQRRQGRVQPDAEREAGGGRAPVPDRQLPDRRGRLDAKGLGQTKPAGSNDTAEGRQQNRRVELVRRLMPLTCRRPSGGRRPARDPVFRSASARSA